MKRAAIVVMVLAALTASLVTGASPDATTAPSTQPRALSIPHREWSGYEAIYQRNIFRKGAAYTPTTRPAGYGEGITTPTVRPSVPSGVWIVTGVAIVGGERVAFLENAQSGATLRVRAGQMVGDATVASVEPEGVTLTAQGVSRKVAVGSQTDGSAAPSVMPTPGGSATAAPAASSTSGAPASGESSLSPGEAAILERMRARRAQEK